MIRHITIVAMRFLLCLPVLIYIVNTIGYWGEPPPLDSMVIFRESTIFYFNDLQDIIASGTYVHPPLLYIVNGISFLLFGKSPSSYNLIGSIIYCLSFFFFFKTTSKVFNRKTATIASLFLFLNPLVIIHSFYLSNDTLIFSAIILSLWAYVNKRHIILMCVMISFVFMKETALVILFSYICIILMTSVYKAWKDKNIRLFFSHSTILILPICFMAIWNIKLRLMGATEWRDPQFISAEQSSFSVILQAIQSGTLINTYFLQNLYHAFFFNFQWVYTTLSAVLFIVLIAKKRLSLTGDQKRFLSIIFFMYGVYIVLVFSFPTWTIPRYVIPVLPAIYIVLGFLISHIRTWWIFTPCVLSLLFISLTALYTSTDPFTRFYYSPILSHGTVLYSIDYSPSGPDGITYNTQFLTILKRQNAIILQAIDNNADVIVTSCDELKFGERIYSININNQSYPGYHIQKPLECLNDTEYLQKYLQGDLLEKTILLAETGKPIEVVQL